MGLANAEDSPLRPKITQALLWGKGLGFVSIFHGEVWLKSAPPHVTFRKFFHASDFKADPGRTKPKQPIFWNLHTLVDKEAFLC